MNLLDFFFPPARRPAATPTRGVDRQPIAVIHGTSKAGFHPVAGADVLGTTRRFGGRGGNASGIARGSGGRGGSGHR